MNKLLTVLASAAINKFCNSVSLVFYVVTIKEGWGGGEGGRGGVLCPFSGWWCAAGPLKPLP